MSRTARLLFRTAVVLAALIILGLSRPTLIFKSGITAQVVDPCAAPITNPVACENTQPGNPISEWDVSGAGSPTIQGFATDISVNRGQTVRFKINTPATSYAIDIYRLGYYGGAGARKIATLAPTALLPQAQPACTTDSTTGLVDCGVWAESASWAVPATAVSGIYIAKLTRTDATAGASHIAFVVRDDTGHSDLLFQTSDTTWQAYNRYGGNSLYMGSPAGRAYKVSYNRPITNRDYSPQDWLFNAEYPMLRFLEANGYNVSYTSGVDTDRRGAELLEHKVFLSVGHDEYWSGAQRANVEAARDAGVHLAFFSGNESFWKTRWEPSIDGSNTDNRTLVCYKETHANAKIDPAVGVWTGTWRDARFSPPNDGGRPANSLTGTLFMVNEGTFSIEVPEAQGKTRLWRNTSVATLPTGGVATLAFRTLGYEWDEAPEANAPAGLVRLSRTTRTVTSKLLDNGTTYGPGTATHSVTMYRAPSGALVFGAGTVQWSWGLDTVHDREASIVDVRMQQATVNLLADMTVQPGTLQSGLVSATASSDVAVPTATITSPATGSIVLMNAPLTISGTATDTAGAVAGVEVSTDNGATWAAATGTTSWTYVWTPTVEGPVTLQSRAIDDSGNVGTGSGITITVSATPPPSCPCTLWPNTQVPAIVDTGADQPVTLGVKFTADVNGSITGIRFYKSAANTGTHVGNLWSVSGTLLGTATFDNETASGWQTANFATPVPITANTTYVASYFVQTGHYSFNGGYFAGSPRDSGPLHAPATGTTPNGVFRYGSSPSFPNLSYNAGNYWVDVVFDSGSGDITAPTVTTTSPAAGSTVTDTNVNVSASFSESLDATTINGTTFELRNASNALVAATVSYDSISHIATLDPSAALPGGQTYTAFVRGGSTDPRVKDANGNALATTFSWSFTVAGDVTPPTVTAVTPTSGATGIATTASVSAVFSEAIDAATVNGNTFELRNPANALVAGVVTYDAAARTATFTPGAALAQGTVYTATIKGGTTDPRVKDASGNALAANATWSFTTIAPVSSGCPCTIWNGSITPAVVDSNDNAAVELGMKFRTSVAGYITGIRFYKAATNTGTHIANLWTSSGTLLATAPFTGETASGWQQVNFASPVAVSANTTYVASYHAPNGHYSFNGAYFATAFDNPPLTALAAGTSANGVYRYGSSAFPTNSYNAGNYWVDVVYNTVPGGTDTTPPTVASTSPIAGASGIGVNTSLAATFSEALDVNTINGTTFLLTSGSSSVAATVSWNGSTNTAVLQPTSPLAYATVYTARLRGGSSDPRLKDVTGNALATDYTWTFSTGSAPTSMPITSGPGGPVLVVTSTTNPFSTYYAEILRAEGLNAFATADISTVSAGTLTAYDVVLLGELDLNASQVTLFDSWVNSGGSLIAMRPDKDLAAVLGLTDLGTTLSEGYLQVNGSTAPGLGITTETMQYHGAADRYTLNGATAVATLFSTASASTTNPAVTMRARGAGMVGAFTYDLAKSIIYTRQGNPAWAGQDRDGQAPVRSNDMFFGNATADPKPDWVDFSKIAIPQADEQQRLLANMILYMNLGRKPLPRFWYLPRGLKAAVVMTGDDHGSGGTTPRFEYFKTQSPANCSVNEWECIRSTSYAYPTLIGGTPTVPNAGQYTSEGFEVAVHVNTSCNNYTATSLAQAFDSQVAQFQQVSPGAGVPVTNRMHCVVWSDYTTQAEIAANKGIRLDTTYYYWPAAWVLDRPGVFTGSGFGMRFAKADGTMLDIYQAATQMTDESSQTYPLHAATLLDRALGAEGYYGTFVANHHTDAAMSAEATATVAAAKARGVPVISSKQLLTWLDGRNGSTFTNVNWVSNLANQPQGGSQLTFGVTAAVGSNGLQGMLPNRLRNGAGRLTSLTRDGVPVAVQVQTVKGIEYATFTASGGNYVASYDTTAPVTTFTSSPAAYANVTSGTFAFSANEVGTTFECSLDGAAFTACTSSATVGGLTSGTHTFRVRGTDTAGNVAATPASYTWVVDVTSPGISGRTPAPNATGVARGAAISVVFSEPITASSVTASTLRLRRVGAGSDVAGTISVSSATATLQPSATLLPGVQYEVAVGGAITDLAGNTLGADAVWTFTTTGLIVDSLAADFNAGTIDANGRVTQVADGEVMLAPTEGSEFNGTTLPAGWSSAAWQAGGSGTVSSGTLAVDGARVHPAGTYSAGRSLEFVATFGTNPFQHAGFGVLLEDFPWAIFSTGGGGNLYARTNNGVSYTDTPLGATLLNAPHLFRIDWNVGSVTYSVDGVQVASHAINISTAMRPIVSDYLAGGDSVRIDWLRLTPYAASSTFVSRVIDATAVSNWASVTWTATVPAGTSVVVSVRTGNTATPDATWSAYTTIGSSGGGVNQTGRYAQYRLQLATTAPAQSPRVQDVTFSVQAQ